MARKLNILVRPMITDDIKVIFETQKEVFPEDSYFEEYAVFRGKFEAFPEGCFVVDMIDAVNKQATMIAHIFTHPWHRDEFPPLNSFDKLKSGMYRLNDPAAQRMLYVNELGVRPIARGFNIGRLLVNHALERININSPIVQLVSVQGSSRFWESLDFQVHQLSHEKTDYLKKNYGSDSLFMIRYLPLKPNTSNAVSTTANTNNNTNNNNNNANNNNVVKKSLILSAY